jgi:hypothetical protein
MADYTAYQIFPNVGELRSAFRVETGKHRPLQPGNAKVSKLWLFTDSCGSFFTFFGLKRGKHGGEDLEPEVLLIA